MLTELCNINHGHMRFYHAWLGHTGQSSLSCTEWPSSLLRCSSAPTGCSGLMAYNNSDAMTLHYLLLSSGCLQESLFIFLLLPWSSNKEVRKTLKNAFFTGKKSAPDLAVQHHKGAFTHSIGESTVSPDSTSGQLRVKKEANWLIHSEYHSEDDDIGVVKWNNERQPIHSTPKAASLASNDGGRPGNQCIRSHQAACRFATQVPTGPSAAGIYRETNGGVAMHLKSGTVNEENPDQPAFVRRGGGASGETARGEESQERGK
ncbi:cadherin EGF LAG seven-pass G-type receptor 1 isoform X2 [Lates japonicus]|uniref:Cadherin EGF LAG seven-pass G-type receptor 1 isoform X2 n=1 Tax=Lates japonicus TaxID=270547 RepID=A0AAD3N142_LATJO|nr:cadherin EGF LAG seven-pass G-type receptor 1 isoform X2 [Lates japonicus]